MLSKVTLQTIRSVHGINDVFLIYDILAFWKGNSESGPSGGGRLMMRRMGIPGSHPYKKLLCLVERGTHSLSDLILLFSIPKRKAFLGNLISFGTAPLISR
jgi:hypothetical protein